MEAGKSDVDKDASDSGQLGGRTAMRGVVIRADIQALRAVSILAVLFYHARISGFSGGYVGVDIFFVISGFLITGLLLREQERTGSIDVWAFWARRARRLLPNALVTLTATLFAVWFLVPAVDHQVIGKDIASAIFYIANYRFALRSVDYFDESVEISPVMHFWSLSVEEQFYLFWPLLFLAWGWLVTRKNGRAAISLPVMVFVICLCSFVGSQIAMDRSQPYAFFATEARIWQLSVGGLLAAMIGQLEGISLSVRRLAIVLGIAVMIACITLLDDQIAYPGWYGLLPVMAAAFVIAGGAGDANIGTRLFSFAPIQWIGLRSYSIYLWHWPVLYFFAGRFPGLPVAASNLVSITLVFAVSALMFKLIEEPFRRHVGGGWRTSQKLGIAAGSSLSVVVLVFGLTQINWLYGGDQAVLLRLVNAAKIDRPVLKTEGCQLGSADGELAVCKYGSPDARRTVVLFGDSYARHLFDGVDAAAKEADWSLQVWTRNSCPPILVPIYDVRKRRVDRECAAWRENAVQRLLAERPALIIISSWAGIAKRLVDPSTGQRFERAESLKRWRDGFAALLDRFREADLDVAVVRSTPRGQFKELMSCLKPGASVGCAMPRRRALSPVSAPDLAVADGFSNVKKVDLSDRFCGRNACYSLRNGVIVYSDHAHHLTSTFARSLKTDFKKLLASTIR